MSFEDPVTLMYAEERASWIVRHAGWRTFQRRRAALLRNAYDDQRRSASGAAPNPHPQAVPESFWLRSPASRAAMLETAVIVAAGVLFPLAWVSGRTLYRRLARLITADPRSLHSVPITALAWLGAATMVLGGVAADPSSAQSFSGAIVGPWLIAQGAGTFMAASVYGVLEGWLAVRGSTDWWPFPPPPLPESPSITKELRGRTAGAAVPENRAPAPPTRSPKPKQPNPKRPWE